VVGFLWQQTARNLLSYLTARQNVLMPMRFAGVGRRLRARRASDLLDMLGVGYCAGRTPAQMSGGEQQRTAIATALANGPRVLLADEPTGNLDSASTVEIMKLLVELNDTGRTVILITHENEVAGFAKRVVTLRDGKIVRDEAQQNRTVVSQ
jgi:ABC-type lipoprotein export system ATPase subunit